MSDAEKHNREVARLDAVRAKGAQAEAAQATLRPLIDARADAYYREVVTNTRASGEVDQATVWKMVALEDLVSDLKQAISRGARAGNKLDEAMAKAGGSDNNGR